MKILAMFLVFAGLTFPCVAADIPTRWLEGVKGYEKAAKLQSETGLPIVVWATWTTCGNCNKVTELIDQSKFKRSLKGSLKVVLDAKGKPDEVAFCNEKGFKGGNFYVLESADSQPVATVWAWKPGTYEVVDGLDDILAGELAKAKKQ